MHVDYTQIFATPDELADFLLLEVGEQDRFLFDLVVTGKISGVGAWCDTSNLHNSWPVHRDNKEIFVAR